MAEADEHFRMGVEAYKAGNYDTDIEELATATELNHEDHEAVTSLGAAYAAKGRYNAAIGAFQTAEQIMPGIASIHDNIAQAYEAAGIPTEAEYEYERALQVDPDYTKARDAYERLKKKTKHI